MVYHLQEISVLVKGQILQNPTPDCEIKHVIFDTRKVSYPEHSIFVALCGKSDGHQYLTAAYEKGIRFFLISKEVDLTAFPEAGIIKCKDVLSALQEWASHHRSKMVNSVIAITGSNGKTIVKEWLSKALAEKYQIGKSPLSYNSQLGVALSILQVDPSVELTLLEAGISQYNEMSSLQKMIRPQIGILTNIGDAHSSGFRSKEEKLKEKLLLFRESQIVIYNKDEVLADKIISQELEQKSISWGHARDADIQILDKVIERAGQRLTIQHGVERFVLHLPFSSQIMADNCMHVISYLILDNWTEAEIQNGISEFSTLPNRLEVKQGIHDSLIIDDSYSSDPVSMQKALEKLEQLANDKKQVVILTPYEQQKNPAELYQNLSKLLHAKKISRIVGIGFDQDQKAQLSSAYHYSSVSDFVTQMDYSTFVDSAILIKGARKYQLEKISNLLAEQIHQTCLETNLSAITHNLNYYRSKLKNTTKIMAVVKAEAYGSGSTQMTKFLQEQEVDYLAVALIDEGARLRKQGCELPLMIFNIQENNLEQLWQYRLEPEVYSFRILHRLIEVAEEQVSAIKIHLKLDSGMHRLGFLENEIPKLIALLRNQTNLKIASIFSHLASSEKPGDDSFTEAQCSLFTKLCEQITTTLDLKPLKHILNTAGIIRFPQHQYDMVRIGLGLYGIDEAKLIQNDLIKAHTLKARIIQIKSLPEGASTGYNRKGTTTKDTQVAIVSIGYADGLMRAIGNGKHQFSIHGQLYPTIGNICMDVMMLDIGPKHELSIGDEVIIFGPDDPIETLAINCNTITYEIISRIAPRVKRTYIYD